MSNAPKPTKRSLHHEAPIGKRFGHWKVVGYSHYANEHHWLVECMCERQEARRASQLTRGRTSSCRTCSAMLREGHNSPFWKGYERMSARYLTRLFERGKEVTITMEDLWQKWVEQGGHCAYSGVKLSLVESDKAWSDSDASIDRIDSSLGYIPGNIQWVHKHVNRMKLDMAEADFVMWCKLVANHSGGGTCGV